ncbi:MAG: DUF4290 domain-containing protein [Paludibacteraceae bacterium]|nr:DUF4290 domain-containing protein [Paludibacteraceae bacterium]
MISIHRNTSPIRMRNYGRIIQDTIAYACTMENASERQALTNYIAQCMRQKNLIWNRDQESGIERIKGDLHILSDGRLDAEIEALSLEAPKTDKKKKDKR